MNPRVLASAAILLAAMLPAGAPAGLARTTASGRSSPLDLTAPPKLVGVVIGNGEAGFAKDPKAAFDWFRKAADGGHPLAPGNIGRLWNSGALGTDGQVAHAVEWDDIGLERGDAWSRANAAWIIVNRSVPGLGPPDAAVRAAKAVALRDPAAAAEARTVLADLPPDDVNAAAKQLVNALGGQLAVDGSSARRASPRCSGCSPPSAPPPRSGRGPPAGALAAAYWMQQKFRVDLY